VEPHGRATLMTFYARAPLVESKFKLQIKAHSTEEIECSSLSLPQTLHRIHRLLKKGPAVDSSSTDLAVERNTK
jgi:hypothetical protein